MTAQKTLVIYHKSDFDGICSGEICKKFMPEAELLGYEYGDPVPEVSAYDAIYLVDMSIKELLENEDLRDSLVWIDHHASAIVKWGHLSIHGLRLDGVAACRLCWQWFTGDVTHSKQAYIDRKVNEPLVVTLLGEYDVWDKRDGRAGFLQLGLKASYFNLNQLLTLEETEDGMATLEKLLTEGKVIQKYLDKLSAQKIQNNGWTGRWEGLVFLILNGTGNSLTFKDGLRPEHDGCFLWRDNGKKVIISLYGVPGKPDIDFSAIAVRMGGGGHKQACGFEMPWVFFTSLYATILSVNLADPAK